MGHFDRDNRGGGKFGKRDFGGRPSFGGGDRGGFRPKPFMHKATCSSCGAECEVPFKPTGDRPVYCNNCFKKGDNEGGKFGGGNNFRERPQRNDQRPLSQPSASFQGSNDGLRSQIESLNSKLDKILVLLATSQEKAAPAEKAAEPQKAKAAKAKPAAKKAAKKKSK